MSYAVCNVCVHGVVVWLCRVSWWKVRVCYCDVFGLALGMFMFVKVMSSLISVIRSLLVYALCLCVWWCSGVLLVF